MPGAGRGRLGGLASDIQAEGRHTATLLRQRVLSFLANIE